MTTTSTHLHTCTLREATCGIVVSVDDGRISDIRGDKDDPHSAQSAAFTLRAKTIFRTW